MSWFRFVLLIASACGLLVSVSANKSTPAMYVSNNPDGYIFLYKVNENIFRLEKTTSTKSDEGIVNLRIVGGDSFLDDMGNKHLVQYLRHGEKLSHIEVKELSKELEDILKKYD